MGGVVLMEPEDSQERVPAPQVGLVGCLGGPLALPGQSPPAGSQHSPGGPTLGSSHHRPGRSCPLTQQNSV